MNIQPMAKTTDPHHYLEKLLEQKNHNLRKTSEELDFLLESIPVIPYECSDDRSTGVTYIHKSVKKVTGFSSQEFLSDPNFWSERIHPDDAKRILGQLGTLKDCGKLTLVYRWQVADGSYKWFSDHFRQLYNKKGEPGTFRGYWLEITEQKK
ncbi:MAG: PAS domain-containing protein [Bacteroidia bacterium]|nr:PAS domain-containing protein [Bacteroidia bacterium]